MRRLTLAALVLPLLLLLAGLTPTADAAGPTKTTTRTLSISPVKGARPGQIVTMKVKVTSADGTRPIGAVHWDSGGACWSSVTSGRVAADGTVTLKYAYPSPYDSYSINACFIPDDYERYQSSADYGFYPVGPTATTTTTTSITPANGARPGQPVTMKVKVKAADGSRPVGTVHWDSGEPAGARSRRRPSRPTAPRH